MASDVALLIVFVAVVAALMRRIARLEAAVAALTAAAPATPPAMRATAPHEPVRPPNPEPVDERIAEPQPRSESPPPRPRIAWETLVGTWLPLGIGGAALVVAGFFLVRYGIEGGWLGPATRLVIAGIFSALLLAAAEGARRSRHTRDDPRIGQVLAGAAVATAYGTLYVAARDGFAAALPAIVGAVLVTAAAVALATRYGAPTAVMALVGGFAAPLAAGVDGGAIGWLLAYLGVVVAALLGLAVQRGWRWLAVATIVAGFGWVNLALVLIGPGGAAPIAGFALLLAVAATLALPAAPGPLRTAPIVACAAQLLLLAPALQYDGFAWTLYIGLALAAAILARRDPSLLPAATAAGAVVAVLVGAAAWAAAPTAVPAAIVAMLLLGAVPAILGAAWSPLALVALAGPPLALRIAGAGQAPLELAAAAALAALAWRNRGDAQAPRFFAAAGLLAAVAVAALVGPTWAPAALALLTGAAVLAAPPFADPRIDRLPALLLPIVAVAAAGPIVALGWTLIAAVGGLPLTYPTLPDPAPFAVTAAILAGLAAARPAAFGTWRPAALTGIAVAATFALYLLAKQPLAIADLDRFRDLGFVERAAITAACALAALALRHRAPRLSNALYTLALARFVWFDLVLLNPVTVPQHVGAVPVANAAVLLPALLAATAWHLAHRRTALAITLVAVAAAVTQVAHGSILIGPVGARENAGYSLAFLLLALAWLAAGIRSGAPDLRGAALLLLAAVTAKVFLLDVAALSGILRILSLLVLGLALIGLGWIYRRLFAAPHPSR